MSFDRIGLPTGSTGVDPHKEPLLPDNKKAHRQQRQVLA